MFFDVNTAIGHWPFRKLANNDAASLRALLESKGINGAAVANTNGVFYMNCHDANLELAAEIKKHRNFFVGVATLNPTYPAWEKDLAYCVKVLGFKGLRLLPLYHNYDLLSPEAVAIAEAAARLRIPVCVPQMLIDRRQKHWLDIEKHVALEDLGRLCLRVPAVKFIFTEYRIQGKLTSENGQPLYPNLYLEASRMRSAYGQELAQTARLIGGGHLLFGSGAPFKEISPAILKVECASLPQKDKEKIAQGNGRKLFGLRG